MTPLAKMVRLMETLELDDRAEVLKRLTVLYGVTVTSTDRTRRWRERHKNGHGDGHGNVPAASQETQPGTPSPQTPLYFPKSFPASSEVVRSEETETSNGTAKLERQERTRTAIRLIDFLNEKAGRSFRKSKPNLDLICARLGDGISEQDCRGVIARKCREWKGTEYAKYLRPETLFNRTKLESYLGERGPEHV